MANLYVCRVGTQERVHTVDVHNKTGRAVEKVMLGMLRNMDTDNYYIDDSEIPQEGE